MAFASRPVSRLSRRRSASLGPNDSSADFIPGFLATASPNLRPDFQTVPVETVIASEVYRYDAQAEDPDGVAVQYLLRESPSGMTLNEDTGEITWQTTIDVAEKHDVELYAFDSRGGLAVQRWTIDVLGGNRAPTFLQPPGPVSMSENQTLVLPIEVVDPDSIDIDVWVENPPSGAFLDPVDDTFYWSPRADARRNLQ